MQRRKANSYREFDRILRKIGKKLGESALKRMHIHVSGVEYSAKRELRHLNLDESDFRDVLILENLYFS